MMISEAMNEKLNEQVTAEFEAAHKYLAMSCSFDSMGYKILAKRFMGQCEEEREHAHKIIAYIHEVGGAVQLTSIAEPNSAFDSVQTIVEAALDGELPITDLINRLVALADKENDYATRSFLGWFVDEQVEEVSTMRDLLDLLKLADGNILQVETRVRHDMLKEH